MQKEDSKTNLQSNYFSFSEVLNQIKNHIISLLIILIVFILMGLSFSFLKKPQFKSEGTFLVSYDNGNDKLNDLNFSNQLTNTVSIFIKKDFILSNVATKNDIDLSSLKKNLSVSAMPNTLIVDVEYVSIDPELSQKILNDVMNEVYITINKLDENKNPEYKMLYDNLKILSNASMGVKIDNTIKYIGLSFILGFVFDIIYIIIYILMDNKFRNSEEVESVLNIPVLASIPKCTNNQLEEDN